MIRKDIFTNDEGKQRGDLGGKYRHSWVEESFGFEKNDNKQIPISSTNSYLGRSIAKKTIKYFGLIMLFGVLLLAGRIIYLQIYKGSEYRAMAEGNRIRIRPIIAERGIIFDRFGEQLVQNVPSFSLAIIPQDLPKNPGKRQAIIEHLSDISGIPIDSINDLIKKYGNYSYESLILKENLDYDTALSLYIKNADLPGVSIESGTKRDYVFTHEDAQEKISSWSHILGYLSKLNDVELNALKGKGYLLSDNIGKTGIEKQYEGYLRGVYGKKKVEVDALGKELNVIAEEAPIPGDNLYLTIDNEAQKKLEDLIEKMVEKTKKQRVGAVAMNPQNGEILALVSWPSFDNNLFSGGISIDNYRKLIEDKERPLFNRVIAGGYPSGSTAKLVVAAAALEEKIITPQTAFLSVGGLHVGRWFFKDWKVGGHGITDLNKAMAWSINTFFYYIGGGYNNFVGLGIEKLSEYFKKFNLGSKTGIDLPGESPGLVPDQDWKKTSTGEQWYIGDTYNLSIGQGFLLVTPLQVASYTSTIANGGKVVQPHIGMKLQSISDKKEINLTPSIKQKNVVTIDTANSVKRAARECVLTGSCWHLKDLPFSSGGKTGTAQWSSTKNTHGWFTAFAPYDNSKIVVTVLTEEGGEGAVVSMPIVRDFLEWWGKKYLTQ